MIITPPFRLIADEGKLTNVISSPEITRATFAYSPIFTGIDNLVKARFFSIDATLEKKVFLTLVDIPDFIEEQIHFGGKGWMFSVKPG